ncbi:MAG: sugar ABC transporter permease [Clostridia bacterium]|nr:sugar ABC transporter permease [Clostridia bacterium]MBR2662754.1 sugar ABC transporter permease [Clostridia bacterium]
MQKTAKAARLHSGGKFRKELPFHLMLIPGVIIVFIYMYIPLSGLIIAFQKFVPAKGLFGNQKWIGWDNFIYLYNLPGAISALRNTVIIAFFKIVLHLLIPITVSILLNEIRSTGFRRTAQTLIYLPHFLSWIILGGILIDILSPSDGILNRVLGLFGMEPIFFLGSNDYFRGTLIVSDVWKEFGFNTIIYLAAITNIDPNQYEAATIDGANRFQKMRYITLPNMRMIIVLMMVLSLGNVLNAGFDQVYNLYSKQVYSTGDILDTFIYRIGLLDAQFGVATAMGMFKSVVSTIFISTSYFCAYKFADYRIF